MVPHFPGNKETSNDGQCSTQLDINVGYLSKTRN